MVGQRRLKLQESQAVLRVLHGGLQAGQVWRLQIGQVGLRLGQRLLRFGHRHVGLGNFQGRGRRLQVAQGILGRQQIALGLIARLRIRRRVNRRQDLPGRHHVAGLHRQREQIGYAAHLFEGQISAMLGRQLPDHTQARAERSLGHCHNLCVSLTAGAAGRGCGPALIRPIPTGCDGNQHGCQ